MDTMEQTSRQVRLNPAQQQIADRGLLASGFNCVLQLPTGAGKTWLAEQAIADTLERGMRAVYLTPLRALASELLDRWQDTFSEFRVGVFTGENRRGRKYPVPFEQAQLLIMTPERLDACTRTWRSHWCWLPEVELVVVDEFHLLGEPHRGPRLEGALLRMRRLNPLARIVGLSATLGNRAELADWLDGVHYSSDWRPVPIEWNVLRFRKATDKPGMMLDEVQRCVDDGGQSLVFVQSRRRAEQLSDTLREAGLRAAHHHAGLQQQERRDTESAYRTQKMDVLVSTGTLEMGVNLPARQVILYDLQRFDGRDFVPLSVNTVWQRAGRAGRRGLDDHGEVVLLSPSWDRDAERYLRGSFEAIQSHLCHPQPLSEQVLTEVASGLARNSTQLRRVFSQSLTHLNGQQQDLEGVICDMLDSKMLVEIIEQDARHTHLKATRLGRIAVRQMLSPATIVALAGELKEDESDSLTFLDLLVLATGTPDCEPLLPADFEELDFLSELLSAERSSLLTGTNQAVGERLAHRGRRLLSVIKTALVVRSWTRTGDEQQVAEQFGCYPFEIRRLIENLERVLSACVAIVTPAKTTSVEPDEEEPQETSCPEEDPALPERIRALLDMISFGIDEEVVSLTSLKGVGGTLARRLHTGGITNIEELALSEPESVACLRGISRQRAENWIEQAAETIQTRSAIAFCETGPTLQPAASDWPAHVDAYRLRRALELNVRTKASHSYLVTGGLEPHRVAIPREDPPRCDCVDFSKGNECKHILAVRLNRRDRELLDLAERIQTQQTQLNCLDLFGLWFDGRS